ncbi:hypothetical protein A0H81_06681 [Grifola frondosa]|uniref:F-box domain-containing protein n=1 Tax=Grifola frondosa TaxID=5627 RepID=A0A1C7M722_GRIFR|nr:hypothetical protein A0H81_06681 [Grifola frondosa]
MNVDRTRSPWTINELLFIILSHLDDRSLSKVVTVCKQWSEIALDILWRDVVDLRRLLSILAPFTRKSQKSTFSQGLAAVYVFGRKPQASDWQRFQRYALRVRRILYNQRPTLKARRRHLSASVFEDIATTCPTPEVFPNLHSLTWCYCTPDRQPLSLVFMHEKVKHLSLQLYRSQIIPLSPYLEQVVARSPSVTHLELRSDSPMSDLEDDLVPFLRGMQALQELLVPMYCLTSRVISALSELANLSAVGFAKPAELGNGDREDVVQFAPTCGEDAFPSLRRLCFSSHIPDAIRFLTGDFSHLTKLYVHTIAIAATQDVREFFVTVQDRCHDLQEFFVDFIIGPDSPLIFPATPAHQRPNVDTFRPLFSCRRLRKFEFRWDLPLNLTDQDAEELASNWASLEVLLLNCEPVPLAEAGGPHLSLRALLPFARHCPDLRHLGLYVNATAPYLAHFMAQPQPVVPFSRLEKLTIGLSAIDHAEPAALFLSQLLPLGCEIIAGLRWPDAYGIALDTAGIVDELRAKMTEWWDGGEEEARLPGTRGPGLAQLPWFDTVMTLSPFTCPLRSPSFSPSFVRQ